MLRPKHKRFVTEYVKDLNAEAAYVRAGYQVTSRDSCSSCASRLLKNAEIKKAIQYYQARESEQTGVNQQRVIRELAAIAFSSVTDIVTWDPEKKELDIAAPESLPRAQRSAIADITQTSYGKKSQISVRMHEKMGALKTLSKFLGLDTELNQAIAVLRRYGLILYQDANSGRWIFLDEQEKLGDMGSSLYSQLEIPGDLSLEERIQLNQRIGRLDEDKNS